MLRDAVVDLIAFRLGQRNDLRNIIIAEMEHIIQSELSQAGHYFLWQLGTWRKLGDLAANASTTTLSGFLALDEDTPLTYVTEPPGIEIPQEIFYRENFWPDTIPSTQAAGPPTYWRWVGADTLEFDKKADTDYGIYGRGYVIDTSIAGSYGDSNNIENRWLRRAADVLIAAVGTRMAQSLASPQLYQMFSQDFSKAWNRAYTADIAQREALADRATTDD